MSLDKNDIGSQKDKMLFFDILAQGVMYVNQDGIITAVNRAAENILGKSSHALKGQSFNDVVWETLKPNLTQLIPEKHPVIVALKKGKSVLNSVIGIKNAEKKKHIWLLVNAVPEFDSNLEKPNRAFITFTEITDQIELEVKLRQKNKLLHFLTTIGQKFINIPLSQVENEITIAIAELGKITNADRLAIFDYDFSENKAYNKYEWCSHGIQSQKDKYASIPLDEFSTWIETLKKGKAINIPNIGQLPTDSAMRKLLESSSAVSLLAVPLMHERECIGAIGVESIHKPHYFDTLEQDVLIIFAELFVNVRKRIWNESQIQESEVKYREITENMSDMVWTMDTKFRITFCSSSIQKIFGFTQEEYMQNSFPKLYPPETLNKIISQLDTIKSAVLSNNISSQDKWIVEGYGYHKSGEDVWFYTEIKPKFDEKGNLNGFIGTTRDETEWHKADLALRESTYFLGERLKEQNCIYQVSLLSQNEELTALAYFSGIVKLLPPAFQFPENTSAFILYDEQFYYSDNFKETNKNQEFEIIIGNVVKGLIKIFIPNETEFLTEEIKMMQTILGIVQKYKTVKLNKRELVGSEEKYRIIANNTYNWEFWQSPNGDFIYHSPSCEVVTGYRPEEISNDFFLLNTLIFSEDQEAYLSHRDKVLKEKCADKVYFKIKRKDQETRVIEHVCQPEYNEQGVFLGTRGTNLDVTEAKKAEEALFESKEIYRSLVESSDAAIMLINIDGEFLFVNEIAAKVFNKSPEDFIVNKYTLFDVAPVDIASKNMAYIEQVFFSQKGTIVESERTINGQHHWFRNSIQPVKDSQGNVKAVFVNASNITEQKLAEVKIRESENKYKTLFADSPDGYLIIKDGVFIDCNKASESILGTNREGIIGKSPNSISPEYQPNGRRSDEYANELIAEAFQKKKKQFEWVHLKANGDPGYVDIILSPIITGDEKILFASWRDITLQKQAQILIRKLQSAVEQSPISIFITDLDGNIEYVNPFTSITTGYSPDELIGENPRILKSGFTNPKVYDELWDTITKGHVWKGILNNRRKNGSLYWESTTITPIMNEVGNIINFIAIKEDITERVKIEREIKLLNQNLENKIEERTAELQNSNTALIQAKQEADDANHAKSEFLSRMSHELRTPMNAILGFAQLLELGDLTEKQYKSVRHILTSGQHLLKLINEVLEISRIEAGKISISLEPVNIMNVFRDVIDTLTPSASAKNIQLINLLEGKESFFIQADKQRIKQIIINLVNNAIKYNHADGWVKLSAVEIAKNDTTFIRICVADNGSGIDEKNIKKLFTAFERIGAENSVIEGTGLGLTVVKQFTNLMNGTCGVESKLNEGSIFWVELPKTKSLIDQSEIQKELATVDSALSEQRKAVVLYVEDNSSNIELVQQIIETQRPNIKLISTVYGKNALNLALEHHPNLILLDLNLPDMHVSEVYSILQADSRVKSIPVIVVSADAMNSQIEKLMDAGVNKYLTKPFNIAEFLSVLDEYSLL